MYSAEKKRYCIPISYDVISLAFCKCCDISRYISRYQRSTSAISVGMQKLLACPRDLQFQVQCFTDQSQCFTRAVAPVYYAHLAAKQVRQFVRFDDASETASSASGGQASSASGGQAPPVPELPRLHDNVESSMFFC